MASAGMGRVARVLGAVLVVAATTAIGLEHPDRALAASGPLRTCGADDTVTFSQPLPTNISQVSSPECVGADLGTVGIAPAIPTSLGFTPSSDPRFEKTAVVDWQWSIPMCATLATVGPGTVCLRDWQFVPMAVDPAVAEWQPLSMEIGHCETPPNAVGLYTQSCSVSLDHFISSLSPAFGPGTQVFLRFVARVDIALDDYTFSPHTNGPEPEVRREYIFYNAALSIGGTVHPAPQAAFTAEAQAAGSLTWNFDASASSAEGGATIDDYSWDFDDDETVSGTDATVAHPYDKAGTYNVTLTVTDSLGAQGSVSHEIEVGTTGLVVNSVGDAPNDPGAGTTCDTGNTVGDDVPECTLRAAIQAANEAGTDQSITFDIDVVGTPQISLASNLPNLTAPATIDATTQPGGWVELFGVTTALRGLTLTGARSAVTGMLFRGFGFGVVVSGADARVVGNRFGTDAAGASTTVRPSTGVIVGQGSGIVIADNVISAAAYGIQAIDASSGEMTGNRIGVNAAGTAALSPRTPRAAILADVGAWTVASNVVDFTQGGFHLEGASSAGTVFTANKVGVNAAGTATLGSQGFGILVDGVPGATVTGNDVAASNFDIGVAGVLQCVSTAGGCAIHFPHDEIDGPVTGTGTVVENNRLGAVIAAGGAGGRIGIALYGKAANTIVRNNRSAGHTEEEILLAGSTGAQVHGNFLGTNAGGTAALGGADGVGVLGATDSVVGGNVIGGLTDVGVRVTRYVPNDDSSAIESRNTTIDDNRIGTNAGGSAAIPNRIGVLVAKSATTVIEDNLISGNRDAGVGVVDDADETLLFGNRIGTNGAGTATIPNKIGVRIQNQANKTLLSDNVIGGNTEAGVALTTTGYTIVRSNFIGRNAAGAALPNGVGITVEGEAAVLDNTIWSNVGAGVEASASSQVLITENSTFANGGDGIETSQPPAPDLDAVRVVFPNGEVRTWFVVETVNSSHLAGLFANSGCDEPFEGRDPLEVKLVGATPTRHVYVVDGELPAGAGYTATVSLLTGETSDGFGIGSTSRYSNCAVPAAYPDTSLTGIPDIIQRALPTGNPSDPQSVTFPGDDGGPIRLRTSAGRFANVQPAAPPPGADGVTFPTGLFAFQVTGVDAGASVSVSVTTETAAAQYWRYGPVIPGGGSRWYSWAFDPATGLGARADLPDDAGNSKLWTLRFTDGLTGDDDFVANGTIVDPGGPGTGALTNPPPSSAASTPASTPAGADVTPPTTSATDVTSPSTTARPVPETLPFTGTSATRTLVTIGVVCLTAGAVATRRTRRARWHPRRHTSST